MSSEHSKGSSRSAWMGWAVIAVCTILGLVGLGSGAWRAVTKGHDATANTSAAMYTLIDTEGVLENEISAAVLPARKRTELLAAEPDVIEALLGRNAQAQTDVLNAKIKSATEIDAVALFNAAGEITAINTCYANGQPIAAERVNRVLGANFSGREIIQSCLRNTSTSSLLEFQTHCDITPAFFNSTGLSVAYSVPVLDPRTNARIGVISSRLRFERLSKLIEAKTIAAGSARAYFVTDNGDYFSESINRGQEQPPVSTAEVREIVRPLLTDASLKQVTKHGDKYLATSSLPGMRSLAGGGIHILIVADAGWLTQGPRQARMLQAGGAGIVGALLLTVAGLVFAGLVSRQSRHMQEEANRSNAQVAAIVESSSHGIISQEISGTIRTWNAGAEKIFGYSAAQAIGATESLVEAPGHEGELVKLCRDVASGKAIEAIETKCRHQAGHVVDVFFSVSPINNAAGETTGISWIARDLTAEKIVESKLNEANIQLEVAQAKLIDSARKAGMAEVATGVLHNVGNVLNSVNVSSTVIAETLKKLRTASLGKIAGLLKEHEANLAEFLCNDNRGKALPGFLAQLSTHLASEQQIAIKEVDELQKNIEHIKQIVGTQQAYASSKGIVERLDLGELVESSLRMHIASLNREDIKVIRQFEAAAPVLADKHKVLQILVNLITNARHAMQETQEKVLTLSISQTATGSVRICVRDSGCGIAPENLTRVFAHGFTTKADGHGFGLHSSALAAKEMKGSLTLHSGGPNQGATFELELPLATALRRAA